MGFIENLQTVANATSLATGDVLEDARLARDQAEESASDASDSAAEALASENLAKDWATKGHNNPVTGTVGVDAKYSAYHWATTAEALAGDPVINDAITSLSYAWSSEYINTLLSGKSSTTHTHAGVYEPAFTKNSAFNKNFAGSGAATTVSRSDHNHSTLYEPIISEKGTAFNKDFGTSAGTVAEGNHLHTDVYEPKRATSGTAYNKNFVVDTENPTAEEIPRGTHIHKAVGLSYDPTNADIISSSTVQGAIDTLDSTLGSIAIDEKCYATISLDGTERTVTITTQDTWTKVDALTKSTGSSKNILFASSSNFTIDYPVAPDNLVEGFFSASITFAIPANNAEIAITAYVNGLPVHDDWATDIDGDTAGDMATLNLQGFLTGLENDDYIELYVKNITGTENVVVHSMQMTFNGAPVGALVATGITVSHQDVTERDAVDQHPTSAITGLDSALADKAQLSGDPLETFEVADATTSTEAVNKGQLDTKIDKLVPVQTGAIATLDANGEVADSDVLLSEKADTNGNASETFDVADGTTANHAVNKGQLDTVSGVADDAIPKVSTPTTGNFPQLAADGTLVDSVYDETSFATASHTHPISEVTNLQTTLDGKYNKVTSPVTNNIATFGAGDVLQDSGKSTDDFAADAMAFAIALG